MISIKTKQEIEIMTEGGKILSEILQKLKQAVKPGITTESLNKLASELIDLYKVKPSFLNYSGYPAVLCTSVNDEVVHAVPSSRVLKDGDIISLDFGVVHRGLHTDSALTVSVLGDVNHNEWQKKNPDIAKLIEVTRKSLEIGIKQVKPGRKIGAIGQAIQEYVEKNGFEVVRDLVGHGIGDKLHEEPYVPNFGSKNDGPVLKEGMTIAIEPMVTMGSWKVKQEGFAFKTVDKSFAAHFEHTIVVTSSGAKILTE